MTLIPLDTPDFVTDETGGVDVILTTTTFNFSGGSPNFFNKTFTTGKSYRSILCSLVPRDHSGVYIVTVNIIDPLNNGYYSRTYTYSLVALTGTQVVLPAPCAASGSMFFQVQGPAGASAFTLTIAGAVSDISKASGLYRTDGRLYPVGQKSATYFGAANGTLISAPGAGSRIMMRWVDGACLAAAATTIDALQATVNGAAVNLMAFVLGNGQSAKDSKDWISGLLLDDNTAVTVGTALAGTAAPFGVTFNAAYDVVS